MRKLTVLELKAHPLNKALYGKEEPDVELIESIKTHGVLVPLTVLQDGTIISGHRRWRAAMDMKNPPKLPCNIVGYPDKLAEEEAVIEHNRQRRKTFSQLMNECKALEEIYRERADKNRLSGLKQYRKTLEKEVCEPVGRVRDRVASHAEMSPRKYEEARRILSATQSEDPNVRKVAVEQVQKLDSKKTSVHRAHQEIKKSQGKPGRPQGTKVEGLAQGTVKRLVQTKLDFFETNVCQVGDKAAELLKQYLEGETERITIKAYKAAEREGRKTIRESDIRRALEMPSKR
jgi:ParB-like chromosome segregation protein Spo0J